MVKKLSLANLADAWQNGTRSWDVTLTRSLLVVMQAALASRIGDITNTKTTHDDGDLPHLRYSDITLKFHHGLDLEHLAAKIVIRGEKGFKSVAPSLLLVFPPPLPRRRGERNVKVLSQPVHGH